MKQAGVAREEGGGILVMEDDPSLGRVIQRYLVRRGFQVDWAADGTEGIGKYREGFYDAVITDAHMPGPSILEIVGTLKKIDGDARILIISGEKDSDEIQKALRRGAGKFLPKPFSLERLFQEIVKIKKI